MKKWFDRVIRSKTMWFNAVIAALAAMEGVFSLLQPLLPGNVFAWLTVALTVGNAFLRTITAKPLADK